MIRARFISWLGVVLCCCPILASSEVRVWKGTLALPVYAEEPPDQNPPFDQFGGPINYPYFLRENLIYKPIERSLRAIYLENAYLKCSILPDLGGHLYTCTDKLSGQSMFYANPSIKKARIGYRGAWAAFGDEFNFPVSHNWVSLSPVDFSYSSHADGSASVKVGNIDRVHGMEWTTTTELHNLGRPVDELAWTAQIPISMVNSARNQYIAGTIYKICGLQRAAADAFAAVEKSSAPNEVYWAVQAAKQSGNYTPKRWHNQLLQAQALSESHIRSPDASYWTYVCALIDRELGNTASAETNLRNGLRLPDRLLAYHLIRLARTDEATGTQQRQQKPHFAVLTLHRQIATK